MLKFVASFSAITTAGLITQKTRHNTSCARGTTQYAPHPASLTIISCKYENRQRLQFTTEIAKTNNNNNTRK